MSALSIRDLEVIRGSHRVLNRVDLDVDAGEIVALMGLSGAGKTHHKCLIAVLLPILPDASCRAFTAEIGQQRLTHPAPCDVAESDQRIG